VAAVMEALVLLVLVVVAAFAAALLVCYLAYTLPRVWSGLWGSLAQGFFEWEAKADADARRARIEEQIKSRSRARNSGRDVDSTFVEAAALSERITSSLTLVKNATKTCCEIQRFTAQVRGAQEMQEVTWDPVCSNLRRYVLDAIDVALDALGSYTIMDRKILKQHIGLSAVRGTCEDCELLKYTVADAPVLCTPAKSLGNLPGEDRG